MMKTELITDANLPPAAARAWRRLKANVRPFVTFALLLLSAPVVPAQETSRQIPFTNLATTLPQRSTQSLTVQLQDASGAVVFAETHPEVAVDNKGRISFVFGALTGEGLNPEHFPAGSSRFLDVVDAAGASVLEGGRVALTAAVFSLSPGPQGPAGPQGPEGPAGPRGQAGPATVVSAGDSSIVIGGTTSAPTVAVAVNGINNTKVADGALSPSKVAGTAATLGANAFNGNQTVNGTLSVTGAINTGTQFNIGGSRVLSVPGAANTFVGAGAGQSNTAGTRNAFFGNDAGFANNTGFDNAFFGGEAGRNNTSGIDNSFFGRTAGFFNTTGGGNSFFGREAGFGNSTGGDNSFFGFAAGRNSQTGSHNSFFGRAAGQGNNEGSFNSFFGSLAGAFNVTGVNNSFFGSSAGRNNNAGFDNTFVGRDAGLSNTTESRNTFVGAAANGAKGVVNATAIGANALVTQSNAVVLGNNAFVGVGTTAPRARLHVQNGHILVGSPGQGLILRSPNGATCRLLTINDVGLLIITAAVCPN